MLCFAAPFARLRDRMALKFPTTSADRTRDRAPTGIALRDFFRDSAAPHAAARAKADVRRGRTDLREERRSSYPRPTFPRMPGGRTTSRKEWFPTRRCPCGDRSLLRGPVPAT